MIIAFCSGLVMVSILACNNSEAAQTQEVDLKENEQLKEKVFDQILNDDELRTEFTSRMRQNRSMMQRLYSGNQMREMMRSNPEMRQQMMRNMMEIMGDSTMVRPDPAMRRQMMQNMMNIMERDTAMQNRMREMMQRHHMN